MCTNLSKQDIIELIKQNDEEINEIDSIKQKIKSQPTDLVKNSLSREKLYKAVLFEDMHKDGFVMNYPHGIVVRQSDRKWHYRGENCCYPTSQPSFIRKLANKTEEEIIVFEFISNMRFYEFFKILNRLKHFHEFRNLHFTHDNKQLYLDTLFYNIAQHYGFDTNWLDITSDFEVALFFACCKFINNKWVPLTNQDFLKNINTKFGRIFRRKTNDFRNMLFPEEKYVVFPVGFQPFMRCHMQYSYAIYMDEEMDLIKSETGFECLKFEHSEDLCNFIYSKTKNGEKIYPHEGLSSLNNELYQIQNSHQFSTEAFFEVYKSLNFGYSEIDLKNILNKSGYTIGKSLVSISQAKIDLINEHYKSFDIEKTNNIKLCTRFTFTP